MLAFITILCVAVALCWPLLEIYFYVNKDNDERNDKRK